MTDTPILIGILQALVGILAVVGSLGTLILGRRFKRLDDAKIDAEKQTAIEATNIEGYIRSLREDLKILRDDLEVATEKVYKLTSEKEKILEDFGVATRERADILWQLERLKKEHSEDKAENLSKIEQLVRDNEKLVGRCDKCEEENKRLSDIIEAAHIGNYEKPIK